MHREETATRSLAEWLKEPLWQSAEGALPTRAEIYEHQR